jgi:hypothetical protein
MSFGSLKSYLDDIKVHPAVITISRGGVLAHRGGFGTFGWIGTGR